MNDDKLLQTIYRIERLSNQRQTLINSLVNAEQENLLQIQYLEDQITELQNLIRGHESYDQIKEARDRSRSDRSKSSRFQAKK